MGGRRAQAMLWILQRGSAALLAVLVVVHLATIVYAVQGGLSAQEILGRTRGSAFWAGFYGLFVLAAAVHAPIGLRVVCQEWLKARGPGLDAALLAFGAALALLGLRAVYAVTGAAA